METSRYYYKAQLIGWSLYILISTSVFILSGTELTVDLIGGIYLVFALGLITSHLYRTAIIRMGWLQKDIVSLEFQLLKFLAVKVSGTLLEFLIPFP